MVCSTVALTVTRPTVGTLVSAQFADLVERGGAELRHAAVAVAQGLDRISAGQGRRAEKCLGTSGLGQFRKDAHQGDLAQTGQGGPLGAGCLQQFQSLDPPDPAHRVGDSEPSSTRR